MAVAVRSVQHTGLVVRDLDASLAFYREMFGLEPDFVERSSGPGLDAATGLEGAVVKWAFVTLGSSRLELLEYETPPGADYAISSADVGCAHVCLAVDDIHQAHAELAGKGVEFRTLPTKLDEPLEDYWMCHFVDPDGLPMELFQLPSTASSR
jgi:catechol 2,3-dioxygenase-like lactoylglutathione lyase family enzyme